MIIDCNIDPFRLIGEIRHGSYSRTALPACVSSIPLRMSPLIIVNPFPTRSESSYKRSRLEVWRGQSRTPYYTRRGAVSGSFLCGVFRGIWFSGLIRGDFASPRSILCETSMDPSISPPIFFSVGLLKLCVEPPKQDRMKRDQSRCDAPGVLKTFLLSNVHFLTYQRMCPVSLNWSIFEHSSLIYILH